MFLENILPFYAESTYYFFMGALCLGKEALKFDFKAGKLFLA